MLDDAEWLKKCPDTNWETDEAESGKNAIVYVGEGEERKVNGKGYEVKVEIEDETVASKTLTSE